MKSDTKFYISEFICIPAVMFPSVLNAVFLGGLLAKWTGDNGPIGIGAIGLFVGYATYKLTSWTTGCLLERLGLLPMGAWRYYPTATSWGGYLKKTESL